jgi:CRISPR-associated protein Cmr4
MSKQPNDPLKPKTEHQLLYLFTRTPLHVGAGTSVGAIDLPVQRERHSHHPIIPGSSIKGVLRYTAESLDGLEAAKIKDMFGPELTGENADKEARSGELVFAEARPLAFPVRSAKGAFAFITCPLALERFDREKPAGRDGIAAPADGTCQAGSKVISPGKKQVVLEEYAFKAEEPFPPGWENDLKTLIPDPVWKEVSGRLVLLSDGDFSHFVTTTTEISHHIRIDPRTGAVAKGMLFDLESVPAETLFFAPVQIVRRPVNEKKGHYQTDSLAELGGLIKRHPVLQFGGNSTTGRGFCSLHLD